MTLIHTHFYSSVLNMQRTMDVLLPDRLGEGPRYGDGEIPVLYLLHGWSDSHTNWQRMTGIERYAEAKGIAVVMPSSDLSFYTDMKYGGDFYQFLAHELPGLVAQFFPCLSTRREDTFVGGLSMGGFGALKLGVLRPERFAAVIDLSGAYDLSDICTADAPPQVFCTFGSVEEATGGPDDIPFQLEARLAEEASLPRFFLACGQQDFALAGNRAFRERFGGRVDLTWHEEPGDHNWAFWDRWIEKALDWLPLAPMTATKKEA